VNTKFLRTDFKMPHKEIHRRTLIRVLYMFYRIVCTSFSLRLQNKSCLNEIKVIFQDDDGETREKMAGPYKDRHFALNCVREENGRRIDADYGISKY